MDQLTEINKLLVLRVNVLETRLYESEKRVIDLEEVLENLRDEYENEIKDISKDMHVQTELKILLQAKENEVEQLRNELDSYLSYKNIDTDTHPINHADNSPKNITGTMVNRCTQTVNDSTMQFQYISELQSPLEVRKLSMNGIQKYSAMRNHSNSSWKLSISPSNESLAETGKYMDIPILNINLLNKHQLMNTLCQNTSRLGTFRQINQETYRSVKYQTFDIKLNDTNTQLKCHNSFSSKRDKTLSTESPCNLAISNQIPMLTLPTGSNFIELAEHIAASNQELFLSKTQRSSVLEIQSKIKMPLTARRNQRLLNKQANVEQAIHTIGVSDSNHVKLDSKPQCSTELQADAKCIGQDPGTHASPYKHLKSFSPLLTSGIEPDSHLPLISTLLDEANRVEQKVKYVNSTPIPNNFNDVAVQLNAKQTSSFFKVSQSPNSSAPIRQNSTSVDNRPVQSQCPMCFLHVHYSLKRHAHGPFILGWISSCLDNWRKCHLTMCTRDEQSKLVEIIQGNAILSDFPNSEWEGWIYLWKETSLFWKKSWKEAYAILNGAFLCLFSSKNPESQLIGIIPIRGATIKNIVKDGRANCLHIQSIACNSCIKAPRNFNIEEIIISCSSLLCLSKFTLELIAVQKICPHECSLMFSNVSNFKVLFETLSKYG